MASRRADATVERDLLRGLIGQSGDGRAGDAAELLIAEFGTLAAVLAASRRLQLRAGRDPGVADRLQAVRAAMVHCLRSRAHAAPVLASSSALLDYVRADMAHATMEMLRVIHLNARNGVIGDEIVSVGGVDRAAVPIRAVIARALELGTAAVLLVHNHPSGDPTPSDEDVAVTRALSDAGRPLGIEVHDHLVVAEGGHVSLRGAGLL